MPVLIYRSETSKPKIVQCRAPSMPPITEAVSNQENSLEEAMTRAVSRDCLCVHLTTIWLILG